MLVPDCIVLFTASAVFVAVRDSCGGKKADFAWFHIHVVSDSAWSYVGLVVEFVCATPCQALKNNANTKSSLLLKQSCGVP
jgi:hypothetical protein